MKTFEQIPDIYRLSSYDYELPEEYIAQYPVEPRDSSRLLVTDRDGKLEERKFHDIVEQFIPGDLLVLNDTKVFPARLYGKKTTGAKIEFLLLVNISGSKWEVICRPGARLKSGAVVAFGEELSAEIIKVLDTGSRIVKFNLAGQKFWDELEKVGHIPLPMYIDRNDIDYDRHRYQTVYARNRGAVAAPTAGMHFTNKLLAEIENKGVKIAFITLNVGWGTFKPIEVEDIRRHHMHREFFIISDKTADLLNDAIMNDTRVIAVGTTTVRALEYAAQKMPIQHQSEWTDIYIYPGFKFKIVDCMITNLHLPKSSLLVMVSAFAGGSAIEKSYRYAIDNSFRFYSYGDAMFLKRKK